VTHLHGICERAASPEQPLGPDVVVPESVPLLVQFDYQRCIGIATLTRAANGDILASADIGDPDPATARLIRDRAAPYFAIGVGSTVLEKDDDHPLGRITAGEIRNVAIVDRNIDPDLPKYEVLAE